MHVITEHYKMIKFADWIFFNQANERCNGSVYGKRIQNTQMSPKQSWMERPRTRVQMSGNKQGKCVSLCPDFAKTELVEVCAPVLNIQGNLRWQYFT